MEHVMKKEPCRIPLTTYGVPGVPGGIGGIVSMQQSNSKNPSRPVIALLNRCSISSRLSGSVSGIGFVSMVIVEWLNNTATWQCCRSNLV